MTIPKKFYITTPIYYVNGKPHIGSALTTVCCDVLARYHKLRGERVFFLTGTDEQATKVYEAAQKAGIDTQSFVDGLAEEFQAAWKALHIENDDFVRTTEPRHVLVVQEMFTRLKDAGYIYLDRYEGWYSVSDETFFRDSDVRDGVAIETGKPVVRVSEENYFFRLSALSDRLLQHINDNPTFLEPEFRRNEVVSFIQQGLRDMSVTRANNGWGIPVPGEPDKVIYVWFDALINYLAVSGWPNDPNWTDLWPADVHLMAKEIFVRFHATLWPAMLLALDLPLPKQVYAHGWWVDTGGQKQGKSTGGLPHPTEFSAEIAELTGASAEVAADSLRYLLLREMGFHGDTEFSHEGFLNRYNTDLANDLGNLTNRSVTMLTRYFEGVVPAQSRVENEIAEFVGTCVKEFEASMQEFKFNGALEAAWRIVGRMNRYIEERTPWGQAKRGETDELAVTLYTCLEAVRIVTTLVSPVMPYASDVLWTQLGLETRHQNVLWGDTSWGGMQPGTNVAPPQPIFPRIQPALPAEPAAKPPRQEKRPVSEPVVTTTEPAPLADQPEATPTIQIDDFMKVELRVADIIAAEKVPNADKLLKLTLNVGDHERTILSGIAEMYTPDELVGRQIVVIANLAPRKMRGIESHGMLLAADVEGQAILLQPETKVPAGARVR